VCVGGEAEILGKLSNDVSIFFLEKCTCAYLHNFIQKFGSFMGLKIKKVRKSLEAVHQWILY
jgi:hypothetical protein